MRPLTIALSALVILISLYDSSGRLSAQQTQSANDNATLNAIDRPNSVPGQAQWQPALSGTYANVFKLECRLWLVCTPLAMKEARTMIPRLCAPLASLRWVELAHDKKIQLNPEPQQWVLSWDKGQADGATEGTVPSVVELTFDSDPVTLEERHPISATADGSIFLPAHQASTFGEKIRYEPQWYKNTVGYWVVPSDYALWSIHVAQPGTYTVAVLQGCGVGQGGSQAGLSLIKDDALVEELEFSIIETGHFQNFRWQHVGQFTVPSVGSYALRVQPQKIAKNALVDIRAIHLVRQASP